MKKNSYLSDSINVSCRAFLEGSRKERIFCLVDLLPVLIPTYMRNLKIICQVSHMKCVKLTDHQVCLSKPLKISSPEKMENGIFYFRFEILTTVWTSLNF